MHFASKKRKFSRARTHKAHFVTHKYRVWISKKSKFQQNPLFGGLCLLCAHHTKNFMRQLMLYNVLRYHYYHLVLLGAIRALQDQELR